MKRITATLLIPFWLASCGGGSNPFEDTGTGTGTGTGPAGSTEVPASLANDVSRITFDPSAGTLSVEGLSFDGSTDPVVYNRRAGMDVTGYQAYTIQQDGAARHSTAFAGQNGSVTAGVAATGGPRNRFFSGAFFERTGNYTPATGEVVYTGTYVGLTNLDNSGGDLLPFPGVDPELEPSQAAAVSGDVNVRANFANRLVEGNIFNRQLVETGTVLPSIVLISTEITDAGSFSGTIEYDSSDPLIGGASVVGTSIGESGGIFGGTAATELAGIIKLTEFDGPTDNVLGLETELETGVFVLNR